MKYEVTCVSIYGNELMKTTDAQSEQDALDNLNVSRGKSELGFWRLKSVTELEHK